MEGSCETRHEECRAFGCPSVTVGHSAPQLTSVHDWAGAIPPLEPPAPGPGACARVPRPCINF
eukprot:scaffold4884_cov122-Isochrysis_galbana.AAC.1